MSEPDVLADWNPEPHPVEIQGIAFEDGGVSISYTEEIDTSPDVMVLKTIMIRRNLLEKEDYDEVLDTTRQWIDHAFSLLRQHRNQ